MASALSMGQVGEEGQLQFKKQLSEAQCVCSERKSATGTLGGIEVPGKVVHPTGAQVPTRVEGDSTSTKRLSPSTIFSQRKCHLQFSSSPSLQKTFLWEKQHEGSITEPRCPPPSAASAWWPEPA